MLNFKYLQQVLHSSLVKELCGNILQVVIKIHEFTKPLMRTQAHGSGLFKRHQISKSSLIHRHFRVNQICHTGYQGKLNRPRLGLCLRTIQSVVGFEKIKSLFFLFPFDKLKKYVKPAFCYLFPLQPEGLGHFRLQSLILPRISFHQLFPQAPVLLHIC